MRQVARAVAEALFRVLFTYDCVGEEKIPATGPAVLAANHPSYLDPILVSLQARRPIRFMAWARLFKVPLLGALIRAFGAFPVDTRPGQGREAYARAKALVLSGEVVGIFPEGKRSRTGWMESSLREGAARLAWETGAPLVPATITGAYRAWPHFQSLPRPARIRVRFHDPIDPTPFRPLPEEQALPALLGELRRRVERSLLPGVKADLRMAVLYGTPAPRPRLHEVAPAVAFAALTLPALGPLAALGLPFLYLVYLFLDRAAIPQSRLAKWIRNGSPLLFVLASGPVVLRALDLPAVAAPAALAAVVLGAAFPYLYERGRVALAFVRDFVAAALLELGAQALVPSAAGAHVALSLYAAGYAWERRSVFWRWTVPILASYAVAVPLLIGGGPGLAVHALASLVAWFGARLFPYHRPSGIRPSPAAIVGPGTGGPPRRDSRGQTP